jgi:phage tail-like protein
MNSWLCGLTGLTLSWPLLHKLLMAFEHNIATGRLLEHLPAIYQDESSEGPGFLQKFLLPFEQVLLGLPEWLRPENDVEEIPIQCLAEQIAQIPLLFDPWETPEEFLPWLAGWAALDLDLGLSSAKKRNLLAHILPLYRIRGTRKYLEELLRLCLDLPSAVNDKEVPALQVGVYSTVGEDTQIGGGPPHYFSVVLIALEQDATQVQEQAQLARRIIDLAKPAHTDYQLEVVSHIMQIGVRSTVGLDTVVGGSETS